MAIAILADSIDRTTVYTLLWCAVAGIIAALTVTYFNSAVIGTFVRALFDNECFSPETAKTAEELSQQRNAAALTTYRKSPQLRRIIAKVKQCDAEAEDYVDENTRFYIDDQMKARADAQYNRHQTSLTTLIVCIAVVVVIGIVLTAVL